MIASRFVLVAVIGLLKAESSQSMCDNKNPATLDQCQKAVDVITLDNGKLPASESEVRSISGDCSLIVFNSNRLPDITPDQIKAGITQHFKDCPGKTGWLEIPTSDKAKKVIVQMKIRAPPGSQWEAWNPDAKLNEAYCFQPKGVKAVGSSADCIAAYGKIPIDSKTGFFSEITQGRIPGVLRESGSCIVQITSTDGSNIQLKKADADPIIINMLKKCDNLPGVVNLKGVIGPNGRVFVQTFASQTAK